MARFIVSNGKKYLLTSVLKFKPNETVLICNIITTALAAVDNSQQFSCLCGYKKQLRCKKIHK